MYESEEEITEVSMPWVHNDAGYSGRTTKRGRFIPGNAVVRAIAIATQQSYWDTYRELYKDQCDYVSKSRSKRVKEQGASIDYGGVWPDVSKNYLIRRDWLWTPTMHVGSGVTMHLTYEEVPDLPVFIARVSKSLVTVIHGVVQDIADPSRDGSRAMYGYFRKR